MFEGKAKEQYELEKDNERIVDKEIEQISRHITNMEELLSLTQKIRDYRTEIYKLKLELKGQLEEIYAKKDTKLLIDMKKRTDRDEQVLYNGSVTNLIAGEASIERVSQRALKYLCFPNTEVIEIFKQESERNGFSCNRVGKDNKEIVYDINGWLVTENFTDIIVDKNNRRIELENLDAISKSKNYVNINNREDNEENIKRLEEKERLTIRKIISIRTAQILKYYESELTYWQEINLINSIENGDGEHYFG